MSTDNKSLAVQKADTFKIALSSDYVQQQLKNAMGDSSTAFAASLIDLYTTDNNLMECDPKQVIMQAMKAAVLKLPVIKSLGYAWIIPYNKVPQFQLGYKGLLQLAIRTGEYRVINTDIVYEGEYRTVNKLTGEFDFNGIATSDKAAGYFAHFEMRNGFSKTLFMSAERVAKHAQKFSKSYRNQSSPWHSDFDAMALKTVLTGLLRKWGYLTVEMANVMNDDEKDDAAEAVANEIKENGNQKTFNTSSFQDATVVDNPNQQAPADKVPF